VKKNIFYIQLFVFDVLGFNEELIYHPFYICKDDLKKRAETTDFKGVRRI